MKIVVFAALIGLALAATLEKEGNPDLAHELKLIEDEIVKVEKHLETLRPTTELGKVGINALEAILKGLEVKLTNELKKQGGSFYEATRDLLLQEANKVRHEAAEVIKKLKGEGKHVLAAEIETISKHLQSAELSLEHLNLNSEAAQLFGFFKDHVRNLTAQLAAKIKSLSGSFYFDTREAVLDAANKVQNEAAVIIKKLNAEGKHAQATEVETISKNLRNSETSLAHLNLNSEAAAFAFGMKEAVKELTAKLAAKIKSLGGAFYETTEIQLLKEADRVRQEAAVVANSLHGQESHLLALEIKHMAASLLATEQTFKTMPATTAPEIKTRLVDTMKLYITQLKQMFVEAKHM